MVKNKYEKPTMVKKVFKNKDRTNYITESTPDILKQYGTKVRIIDSKMN